MIFNHYRVQSYENNSYHTNSITEILSVNFFSSTLSSTVVIWSRSFGHFRFRERGYLLTIYININIYIIVAFLTASVFDFDQMTNDQMTASSICFLKNSRGNEKKLGKHSCTAMKDSYLCITFKMCCECGLRLSIAKKLTLHSPCTTLVTVNESRSGDTPRTQSERARNENSPQRPRE